METNERTPLLGNSAAANGLGQLTDKYVLSNEQTPLDGNTTAFNEQPRLDGVGVISNEQTAMDGDVVICDDKQSSLEAKGEISNKQTPLEEIAIISDEQETPSGEDTSNLDTKTDISCPRNLEKEMNCVSLEEVVQALCSAWKRNSRKRRGVTLDFFTTKELYAMNRAWKNVTRGRRCSSPPHIIANSVAAAIVKENDPSFPRDENDLNADAHIDFTTEKNLIAVNFLNEWPDIDSKGRWFPSRYKETIFEDSDEQPDVAVSEFWLRQVDLYDRAREFFLNQTLQILLHCLMIIWPISLIIVGSKYMDCPMGHHLSHLLMILGCLGCLAILVRLALMLWTVKRPHHYEFIWKWRGLKLIEFTFFVVFIVEASHFFSIDPTAEKDPVQCTEKFYNEALVLNYMSTALTSAYVFAYSIIFCVNQFDFWHWIIRHLKV